MNNIGKWLAHMTLLMMFNVELCLIGLDTRDIVYWLITIPGSWGLVWVVNKLDNEHNKDEEEKDR